MNRELSFLLYSDFEISMQVNYNEFKLGNWVVHVPEGNYCTIKSLSPEVVLQGALRDYSSTIEQICNIKITKDKLQVCGFEVDYPFFTKNSKNGIYVAIVFVDSGVHKLCKYDEPVCNVRFIHEVQNAYYEITGELLEGNLYGVRED